MNKIIKTVLLLSLAANAIWLLGSAAGYFSITKTPGDATRKDASTQPPPPQPSGDAIVSAAKNGDATTLLTLLKAAGLDAKSAGFMSAGLELQKLADQQAQILKSKGPYWRNNRLTHADLVKLQQSSLEFHNRLQDLVPDLFTQAGATQYDYLDPDRRAKLLALERDYKQLTAETRIDSSDFRLQSDTDKLKAIAEERKREIDQFLTPDEIAARDLRESPAAKLLRNNYGIGIDTEAEYRAAYDIMQAAGADKTAQDAARAQVEAMLGPDRMAKIFQTRDPDYYLIQTAADRLNLPAEATTTALMDIRDQARQACAGIAADTTLTADQRKAALQALAAQSQEQMSGVLGAEGSAAFAKKSQWMTALNKGSTFTYSAKGRFQVKK